MLYYFQSEVRIPADQGIAGHVATTGIIIWFLFAV